MGWWDGKLGNGATPRRTAPLPGLPQGGNPYTQMPPQAPPAPPDGPLDEYMADPGDPYGHRAGGKGWFRWKGNPRGGLGETETFGACPACGDPRYFSQKHGAVTTQNGVVYPKPACMACGYPYEQAGSGMVTTSTSSGPVRASRQAEAPPPPGSIGHLRRQ